MRWHLHSLAQNPDHLDVSPVICALATAGSLVMNLASVPSTS